MAGESILVTGASGLLGATLLPLLRAGGRTVLGHGHRRPADVQADLSDPAATQTLLRRVRPEVIVNLAALTDVDRCEAAPQQAYLHNVRSVENLAAAIRSVVPGCHLVQLSTDQVYDGAGPHDEAGVCITNTYAFSKIAAEIAAAGVGATVLRSNFYGRSQCAGRASFSDWLFEALSQRRAIEVFDDVLFNPMAIDALAACIAAVVVRRPGGVFNLGARGGLSKADFAFAFADAAGLPCTAMRRSTSTAMARLKAYRPKDMRMAVGRFEQALGLTLPDLRSEIQRTGSAYRESV